MPKGSCHRGGSEDYRFDLMIPSVWKVKPLAPGATAMTSEPSAPVILPTPAPLPSAEALPPLSANNAGKVAEAVPILKVAPVQAGPRPPITLAEATEIAEQIYEQDPYRAKLLWPKKGIARGDYNLDRLIPALENWIAEDGWIAAQKFLDEARLGRAREFIEESRRRDVQFIAKELVDGDQYTLAEARRFGFDV